MKSEIQLNSRYGLDNRLIQVDGDPLKFKLKASHYYRVGFKDENMEEYTFIDPAGGPFITIGSEIDGHKVKAIHKDGIIEFEP